MMFIIKKQGLCLMFYKYVVIGCNKQCKKINKNMFFDNKMVK